MPDRDGSPSNAKRLKPNEQSFGALSASSFPSPPRSPAPVSSPLNSRKDAVNQSPGGNQSAAKGPGERAPDVVFETYTEYTSRGKPVPRDVVWLPWLGCRRTFEFPQCKFILLGGFILKMDKSTGATSSEVRRLGSVCVWNGPYAAREGTRSRILLPGARVAFDRRTRAKECVDDRSVPSGQASGDFMGLLSWAGHSRTSG